MDHTKMRNATRYKIQKSRRLKQHLQKLYMVGQYADIAKTVKELSQINYLKGQAL